MKRQGTRDQGNKGTESLERLLRQALPPIGEGPDQAHDLWPAMLRKLDERPASVPWYDWALIGAVALLLVAFPASIPVFLYYL